MFRFGALKLKNHGRAIQSNESFWRMQHMKDEEYDYLACSIGLCARIDFNVVRYLNPNMVGPG
jgi:hypothetical protein